MIYFIGVAPDWRFVKIGYGQKPRVRMSHLQCATPFELRLLLTAQGNRKTESALHRQYRHLRVRREWFSCTAELRTFLDSSITKATEKYKREQDRLTEQVCEEMEKLFHEEEWLWANATRWLRTQPPDANAEARWKPFHDAGSPLGVMGARAETVLFARFIDGLSYEAIAADLLCSRERIRQIEAKALREIDLWERREVDAALRRMEWEGGIIARAA